MHACYVAARAACAAARGPQAAGSPMGPSSLRVRLARVASHLAAAASDTSPPPLSGPQRGGDASGRSVAKSHGNDHDSFPAPGRPPPAIPVPGYLAHRPPTEEQLERWVDQFHTDGFIYVEKVLPPALCAQLRADLDWSTKHAPAGEGTDTFHPRMFELSAANLSLFELEPIVSFAEALIDRNCHVVHNNSFTSPGGNLAGKGGWHQDDRPHVTTVDGRPLPPTVRLAVQLFTANYILTDVDTPE